MPGPKEEEEYEIIPHERLLRLEREVSTLKEHPLGATEAGQTLIDRVERLTEAIEGLTNLFKEAASQIKLEEKKELPVEKMKPILDRMKELSEQNEKIARGIITVAEMLKEKTGMGIPSRPMPMMQPRPMPNVPPAPRTMPPPPRPPGGSSHSTLPPQPFPPPPGPPPTPPKPLTHGGPLPTPTKEKKKWF